MMLRSIEDWRFLPLGIFSMRLSQLGSEGDRLGDRAMDKARWAGAFKNPMELARFALDIILGALWALAVGWAATLSIWLILPVMMAVWGGWGAWDGRKNAAAWIKKGPGDKKSIPKEPSLMAKWGARFSEWKKELAKEAPEVFIKAEASALADEMKGRGVDAPSKRI